MKTKEFKKFFLRKISWIINYLYTRTRCEELICVEDKLKNNIRSSISSRTLADMLRAVGMNRLITIELHAGAIIGMYSIPVIHLNGNKIFTNYTVRKLS